MKFGVMLLLYPSGMKQIPSIRVGNWYTGYCIPQKDNNSSSPSPVLGSSLVGNISPVIGKQHPGVFIDIVVCRIKEIIRIPA